MTKQTEALKMALRWFTDVSTNNEDEVIQACKEALAQLAQEPVAWVKDNLICPENNYETTRTEEHPKDLGWTPLYSHPAPQPVEPQYLLVYNINGEIKLCEPNGIIEIPRGKQSIRKLGKIKLESNDE